MQEIIRCSASQGDGLSGMLARAFFNDPLYQYVFPHIQNRLELITWEMDSLVRYGLHFGQVFASASLEGCAVWLPPGETDFTTERMAQVGMLDSAQHIGVEAAARLSHFVEATEAYHRKLVPQPHWYLLLLGVEPSRQGQGLGSALLEASFPAVDAGGYPVYLETLQPDSLPFYQHWGFTVQAQAPLMPPGVDVWYLLREPQSG